MNTYLYIGAAVLILVAAIAAYALYRTYKVVDTREVSAAVATLNTTLKTVKSENVALQKKIADLEKNFTTFVDLFDKQGAGECEGDVCPIDSSDTGVEAKAEEVVEEPELVGTVPREANPSIQLINSFLGMLSPGTPPNVEVVDDALPDAPPHDGTQREEME